MSGETLEARQLFAGDFPVDPDPQELSAEPGTGLYSTSDREFLEDENMVYDFGLRMPEGEVADLSFASTNAYDFGLRLPPGTPLAEQDPFADGRVKSRIDPANEIFGDDYPGIFTEMRGSMLVINGSSEADSVRVDADGDDVVVSFFGDRSWRVPVAGITAIAFRGYKGDDGFVNNTAIASIVFGDEGDDILFGGSASDELHGGDHADMLFGRHGTDTLVGDTGPYWLYTPSGDAWVNGDPQGRPPEDLAKDEVPIGNHGQVLDGEYVNDGGRDQLVGGPDDDRIEGKHEDDTIVFADGDGMDTFLGGKGFDTVEAWSAQRIVLTKFDPSNSIELLVGGNSGLDIYGTSQRDELDFSSTTLRNISVIDAGGGDDEVIGSDGDDHIYGRAGSDRIYGGMGRDLLHGNENDDRIFGGPDDDVIIGHAGIDRLYGGSGDDWINGKMGNDFLYGGDGEDSLRGRAGVDKLYGGDDDDELVGGGDTDWIYGEVGNDVLHGADGDDHMWGGPGQDKIFGGDHDDELYGGFGVDFLYGEAGVDTLWGGSDDDQVWGGSHDDWLHGNKGNDSLFGGGGDDWLDGGHGGDQLFGYKGNDTLIGFFGHDRLDGGTHDDQYEVTVDLERFRFDDRPGGRDDYVFMVQGRQQDEETITIDVDLGSVGRKLIAPVFDAVSSMVAPFDFLNDEIPGSHLNPISMGGVEIYGGHDLDITYFDVLKRAFPGYAGRLNLIETLTNLENPIQGGIAEIRDVEVRGDQVIGNRGAWAQDILNSNKMRDLEELGFQFDFLQSPEPLIAIFMSNNDVDLITYRLRGLEVDMKDGQEFRAPPPVPASIEVGGEMELKLSGTIGLDSHGMKTGIISDGTYFRNVGVTLTAGLYVQVALDIELAEAGVESSVQGRLTARIRDPNGDGKARLYEIDRNRLFEFQGPAITFNTRPYAESKAVEDAVDFVEDAADFVKDVYDWF